MIYDETCCTLGEGPLWHPERQELFWFDILGRRLHTKGGHREFAMPCSAAGWIDRDTLLVASSRALHRLDIETGALEDLCPLEADTPGNRSNDGRADPMGGFWIGTMDAGGASGQGAIYRYYRGELRQLFAPISIPNAICFTPEGGHACFADTPTARVMRVALDGEGWPKGDPEVFVDMTGTGHVPDGAVIDEAGNLWCANWGSGRVGCHGPDGSLRTAIGLPARQTTCPAFGGEGLSTLYCTSAAEGLDDPLNPHNGRTFAVATGTRGQREHRVVL